MLDTVFKKYNQKSSLLVFSSYAHSSEAMKDQNALAWYTKHLLSSFPKNKHIIFLSEKTAGSSNLTYEAAENILVIPCWEKNNPLSIFNVFKALRTLSQPKKMLFQFEFNIFGTVLGPLLTLMLTLYMALKRVQIYFQIHQIVLDISLIKDQINLENKTVIKFFNICLNLFYRTIFFLSKKVIVTEEALATKLRGITRANKLVILHHHVLKESPVITEQQNSEEKTLLFFGYISWYKGVDWLVDTFKELRKEMPNLKLVIAGGESPTLKHKLHYKKYYRNLMNAIKDEEGITHTGFVSDEEARVLFSKADMLVLPYRIFMSSSGPLSWALAFQKPVILASTLKEYTHSPDFIRSMKMAQITDQDLFFDLTPESFKKVVQAATAEEVKTKLVQFSTTLAEKRSQKNITRKLYSIIYPPQPAFVPKLKLIPSKLRLISPLNYAK
ncbi:MAG: glycosyltransferase [Patescibacteria group bacterium]